MSTHVNQDLKPDGTAVITFEGDQITWNTGDPKQNRIQLFGSGFSNVVAVATLAFSALYGVTFVVILWEYLQRRGPKKAETDKNGKKKYKWSVGTAMLCMILFYATDLFNRIEHERQRIEKSYYVAINIPLGVFPSLADGLLLTYLIRRSPVKIDTAGRPAKYVMYFAFIMYWLIGICTKGAQIWDTVQQFTPRNADKDCKKHNDCAYRYYVDLSLRIEQDLASAASGMMLLFSIGYALFSLGYVNHPPNDGPFQKRLSLSVVALAAFFLSRNIVNFAFTLIYAQFDHSAALGIQLVYVALWGILTVAAYISVVFVEAIKHRSTLAGVDSPDLLPPTLDTYTDAAEAWPQEKPQFNTESYPYQHPYGYQQHQGYGRSDPHFRSG